MISKNISVNTSIIWLSHQVVHFYQHETADIQSTISVQPTQPFGPRPPLGGKKIFQKEQPVMVKKPSLSIHIELYIIYPFPNNKYWRTFFSFFYLRKDILPDFSLLGFKRKRIWIWKRKKFLGRRKKSLLICPCRAYIDLLKSSAVMKYFLAIIEMFLLKLD